MDNHELINRYVFPYHVRRYPEVSKKILGLMFVSNQKYFSLNDIITAIKRDRDEIIESLEELISRAEVACRMPKTTDTEYMFYLNIYGLVNSLQQAILENRSFIQVLERTMNKRDDTNGELNQFIKNSIVLNSEVVDFVDQRVKAYFDEVLDKGTRLGN